MIEKIFKFRRTRKFYFKVIGYTLFLSLLPVLIISIYLYHNVKASLKTELLNANSNYLSQTANALEIIINQIGNNFKQFALDSTMREWERFPRGSYYEGLNKDISDLDLPILARYINSKAKVRWNLDNMKSSNDFIHSVFLIDRAKDITLTSIGSELSEDEANAQEWIEIPDDATEFPYFMAARYIDKPGADAEQILPVIYKSPNLNSYMVVNLNAELIYAKIVKNLEKRENETFFALSKSNAVLLHDGREEMYGKIRAELENRIQDDLHTDQDVIEYNNKRMLVTSQTSQLLGWTFVRAIDLDGLYSSIFHIKGLIFLSSFLLIVATGLLAFMASQSIYGPVFRLLAYMKSVDYTDHLQAQPNTQSYDEFKTIETRFTRSIEDRANLQHRLRESLPAYKEKFLTTLIKNNRYSREEMIERILMLGLRFDLNDMVLLNVLFDDRGRKELDFSSRNLIKLQIVDILERVIFRSHSGFIVEMSEDLFTVVLNSKQSEMMDVYDLAENMKSEVKGTLDLICTIGIGRHCSDVYQLHKAYDEAEEAIGHRGNGGMGEVIYIEDVRLESLPIFVYPKEKETTLNQFVKNGEKDQAKQVFAEFVKEVKEQQDRVQYQQLLQAFVQLWVRLLETASNMRLDLPKVLGLKNNLFTVLLQMKDVEEMIAWTEDMIGVMSVHIKGAFREKKNNYIQEVMKLIDKCSGNELSLSYAADHLQLNPAYLSRIFRDKTGMNFLEYLTHVRIEKSKKLLHETNWKIKEIGEISGYSNVNYFIRVFKEMTGTTPREYRKLYSAEGLPATPGTSHQ